MMHKVTFIPGDGIGPDVAFAARRVVEATGVQIEWEEKIAGEPAIEKYDTPLPDDTLESIKRNKVAFKGPITTPIGGGYRSVNVLLRQLLNLYACVRPARSIPGTKTPFQNIDLVVIRENTEDVYAGVEFPPHSEEAKKIISLCNGKVREDSAITLKPISFYASERIVRFAFRYAIEHNRKKVTCVTKANIMKFTDGLFLEAARKVAEEFPQIEFEERLVDNMAMQLVQKPHLYDVLVTPNLYGDILSDLCAGLIGGLGVAPGANIGDEAAVFEPVHGSAPKYKGMNKVNPTAAILSAAMMLDYLGEKEASQRIEKAVREVIAEGKWVTYDLGGNASTTEMTEAIIDKLGG
jgi:isocitrate dehydrogenase (NAD+)